MKRILITWMMALGVGTSQFAFASNACEALVNANETLVLIDDHSAVAVPATREAFSRLSPERRLEVAAQSRTVNLNSEEGLACRQELKNADEKNEDFIFFLIIMRCFYVGKGLFC